MSSIYASNDQSFIERDSLSSRAVSRPRVIPMPFSGSDLDMSNVPATAVLGYLLALVSAAVLLLTGEPPWFLLTAVVALAVAFFLPKGPDVTGSE